MRDPLDPLPPPEDGAHSLDEKVHRTFSAWDEVHVTISGLRGDYDAAMRLYERFGFEKLGGPLGNTGHFSCDRYYARDL